MGLRTSLSRPQTPFVLDEQDAPETLKREVIRAQSVFQSIQPKEPTPKDLEATYMVMRAVFMGESEIESVTTQHIRRVPWVLFTGLNDEMPPLCQLGQIGQYLKYLRKTSNERAIQLLAYVVLRDYPEERADFHSLLLCVSQLVHQLKRPKGRAFAARSSVFRIFDKQAPSILGQQLVDKGEPFESVLIGAGLTGECLQIGLAEAAFSNLLDLVKNRLSQDDSLPMVRRIIDFSTLEADQGGGLKYPNLKARLADALLSPYRGQKPGKRVKKNIKDFMLLHFSDPRINRGAWIGVSRDALEVFMSWLSEETLNDFFKLLDYTARYDASADKQWQYRRALWSTYLRHGHISDAWFALGKVAAASAKEFIGSDKVIYGKIAGPGVINTHSVLILRIGDYVISEWSHSGKYRLWHVDDENAPKFYRKSYTREDVVGGSEFDDSHFNSPGGLWQRRVTNFIESKTGIRIGAKEYMKL